MRTQLIGCVPLLWTLGAIAEIEANDLKPEVIGRPVEEGGVTRVYLAPRYATAIRMPEPVSSLVLGDPGAFSAEHSEKEPNLVFVKPVVLEAAQTNLLISTVSGHQVSLLLVSRGKGETEGGVDFLMRYKPAGRFVIEPVTTPSAMVPQIAALARSSEPGTRSSEPALDELLNRQRRAPVPRLYGTKPGQTGGEQEPVKAGVSEVIDGGRQVIVLFSAVNTGRQAIELMPPQVQLSGSKRKGISRRAQWVVAEQLRVLDFRLNKRRIGRGERADGVVVFERPSYKQSHESVFLQMAASSAVDRPARAPIGFGIDSIRKEGKE